MRVLLPRTGERRWAGSAEASAQAGWERGCACVGINQRVYEGACAHVAPNTSKRTAVLMQHPHAARPSDTRNALPQGPLRVELSTLPRVWFGMSRQHHLQCAGPREEPYTCHKLGQDQAFLS